MDIWHSLGGMVEFQIGSADSAGSLNALNQAGIQIFDVKAQDEFSSTVTILRKDWKRGRSLLRKRGDLVTLRHRKGFYWRLTGWIRRPILVFGLCFLLLLACFIPSRVLFVRVEGNTSVPSNLILEKASQAGIYFGASRREVRSEKMKNTLLELLPQLQWAGINTKGCVAVITVRERPEMPTASSVKSGVSSLVASRDGVIESCTATKGNLLCKVGQAVVAGQTLISGYTDCGISIRATQAQGEIFARTNRIFQAFAMEQCLKKTEPIEEIRKYSVIFGKKRINFSKGSGILDTTCDKIYEETYLQLPGGFRLPIIFVTEIWIIYKNETKQVDSQTLEIQLTQFAQSYLSQTMVAGQVLNAKETVNGGHLQGEYACREMIGKVREEEIIPPNGKWNGT